MTPGRPDGARTATRTTSSPRPSRWPSAPRNIVPGIDFTNDPLLQGRLFSYLDTQLTRLGGPNFAELPINRPLAPVHNNQRDGLRRHHPGPAGQLLAQLDRRRRPRPAGRQRVRALPGTGRRAEGSAAQPDTSPTTTAKPGCSGTAWSTGRSGTSWPRTGSSWARWSGWRSGSGWSSTLTRVDPGLEEVVARRIGVPRAVARRRGRRQPLGRPPSGHRRRGLPRAAGGQPTGRRPPHPEGRGAGGGRRRRRRGARRPRPAGGRGRRRGDTGRPRRGTLPDGDGEPLTVDRPLPTTASVLYDAVVVPDDMAPASDPDAVRSVTEALRHGKPPWRKLGSGAALLRGAGAAAPDGWKNRVHGAGEPAGESVPGGILPGWWSSTASRSADRAVPSCRPSNGTVGPGSAVRDPAVCTHPTPASTHACQDRPRTGVRRGESADRCLSGSARASRAEGLCRVVQVAGGAGPRAWAAGAQPPHQRMVRVLGRAAPPSSLPAAG